LLGGKLGDFEIELSDGLMVGRIEGAVGWRDGNLLGERVDGVLGRGVIGRLVDGFDGINDRVGADDGREVTGRKVKEG
jgi:hypothetical protein